MGMLVEVDDIHVRYGDLVALRGISLKVEESEVVCIIGPNGAGKTTPLAAIAGGVTPHAGTIRVGGQNILGQRPEQIARRGLWRIPERRHIFGTRTVEENLRIGGYIQ